MINAMDRDTIFVVINELTHQPYDENVFSRLHRRFRRRAKIRPDLTFHDLRRTALSELGDRGATNAEIIPFSGHDINSRILKDYVQPGKEVARRGASKRQTKRKT